MYTLTVIYADGRANRVDLYEQTPSLKDLQSRVGGYIEQIPHFRVYGDKYCIALCDEEGKLKSKHENVVATALWWINNGAPSSNSCNPDVLFGDVVIVTADTLRELEEL